MQEIHSLIGKVLLIGITILDDAEELIEQIQVYGSIVRVDANGVAIKRNGTGVEFSIPPDFDNIHEAEPGEYRLRSTGEVLVDPDYINSWTLKAGSREKIDDYRDHGFAGYIAP